MTDSGARLSAVFVLLLAGILMMPVRMAQAAELVMFEKDGCPWCLRWHQEIGPGYPHSEEGRRAPLRVVKSHDGNVAGISLKSPVTLSPTFVLVEKGREVGRLVGYPGADFFYGLLAGLLQNLDKAASKTRDPARKPIWRTGSTETMSKA